MKFWKLTLLTVCCFFAISATVLITSCEKDACTELKCKNGSACTEGFCRCQTGYEGAECDIKAATKFLGIYYGYNHCDDLPALLDTADVYLIANPNIVEIRLRKNNNQDKFQGVVDGNTLTVKDTAFGTAIRKVSAIVDHNQLTMLVERNFNANEQPGSKSVCTFVGLKK